MRLYRICPENLLENYSGLGASYQDGARWNKPGLPALYFGASASVAMLEMANYLLSPRLIPKNYRLGIYEPAGKISSEEWQVEDLPSNWNSYPYPSVTQEIGSKWLMAAKYALLFVPSAAIPGGLENIVLFNPIHPDSRKLKLVSIEKSIFNERTFSSHQSIEL